MCTIAWGETGEALWVCFNRDELLSREPAEAPALHNHNGQSLVYARDPRGGGTWFAASAAGFAVALLNHYPGSGGAPGGPTRSRGGLVLDLAVAGDPPRALEILAREDLSAFAPFCLFLLAPGRIHARTWDGSRLQPLDYERPFWTTSSFKPQEVVAWRTGWWLARIEGRKLNLAEASRLMRKSWPEDPAYGLTMDRPDARTLSQIALTLSPQHLEFSYRPRDSTGPGYGDPLRINLPA